MADVLPADRSRIALVSHLVQEWIRNNRPPGPVRVLDLACRTGAFSYALASQGIKVVGLEGRQENLDVAPAHENIEYVLGDVRDLSRERFGTFDVTLCLGLLYHLTAEDALRLLRAMTEVTTGFAILDTHISCHDETVQVEGQTFFGHRYPEPDGLWSSIGNNESWWFSPNSLREVATLANWHLEPIAGPSDVPEDRCWSILTKKNP